MAHTKDLLVEQGIDPQNVVYLPGQATVEEVDASADSAFVNSVTVALQINEAVHKATPSMIGENEKPRMLKLTSWLVHAGYPNDNRDGFLAEDLQKRVNEGLFGAPYFGAVDFNHDFDPRGVLYNAEWAYDEKAEGWGIRVEGAVFAWKYPDLADKLLAEQTRLGHIRTSAAWVSKDIEVAHTEEGGRYWLHRDPIFFCHSVLDVDPADPHSRAIGSEDIEETEQERKELLSRASKGRVEAIDNTREDLMDEKILEQIEALLEEQGADLRAVMATALEAAEQIPQVRTDLEAAQTSVTELTATKETATATLDEANTTIAAQTTEIESFNEELETLRAFKAERDAEVEEARVATLKEERLAALPEGFVEALNKGEEASKERMIARYVEMEEEEFTAYAAALAAAIPSKGEGTEGFTEKSKREGLLSGVKDRAEGSNRISKWLNRS